MTVERRFFLNLVREVLRLKFVLRRSNRQIALAVGISKSTVATYIGRAKMASLTSFEMIHALNDDELKAIIFNQKSPPGGEIVIDYEYIFKELKKKHVTLMLLWKELSQVNPHFYKYSRFCELYQEWRSSQSLSLRVHHKAGEKIFIDYAGSTIPIRNPNDGTIREAQIFVAALGASSYTYIEATWTQTSKDFIQSNVRALEFFGGIPEILVPDNLKSGVNESCRYEPQINRNYREMAKYYEVVVIPARAYRPKDKAKVENAVLVASRWILAALRNMIFFSLEDLNDSIKALLFELNTKKFQKIEGSRQSLFEELEMKVLRPLPPLRYIFADWKQVKVNNDYHVELEQCYYSVPYRLRGKTLQARYSDSTVELFCGANRVASHMKLTKKGTASTLKEHMPKGHRDYLGWSPLQIIDRGKKIGPYTEKVISGLFEKSDHPELAYRSGLGILRLEKSYGPEKLEKASERALAIGGPSYRSLKSILEKGLESQPIITPIESSDPIDHNNIRGAEYYH